MDRITMPSALLSCLLLIPLRGQESCQKQVVIRHRGGSQRNMGLPAYGTQYPSATILGTELCVRSEQIQTPLHCRLNTMGMINSRGTVFATADTSEAHFPMIASLRGPRFQAAIAQQTRFHTMADHERKRANRAVQLIAGRSVFRAKATVIRRSGTGPAGRRAGRVPSLPLYAIHPLRQPAIPDGGRSPKNICLQR